MKNLFYIIAYAAWACLIIYLFLNPETFPTDWFVYLALTASLLSLIIHVTWSAEND